MDNLRTTIDQINELAIWLEQNGGAVSHQDVTERKLHDLIHLAAQAVYQLQRDKA